MQKKGEKGELKWIEAIERLKDYTEIMLEVKKIPSTHIAEVDEKLNEKRYRLKKVNDSHERAIVEECEEFVKVMNKLRDINLSEKNALMKRQPQNQSLPFRS